MFSTVECFLRIDASGASFDDVIMLRVYLTKRELKLLQYLIENSGRLVSHEELLDALWPNVHVQPEGLQGGLRRGLLKLWSQVSQLRCPAPALRPAQPAQRTDGLGIRENARSANSFSQERTTLPWFHSFAIWPSLSRKSLDACRIS